MRLFLVTAGDFKIIFCFDHFLIWQLKLPLLLLNQFDWFSKYGPTYFQ